MDSEGLNAVLPKHWHRCRGFAGPTRWSGHTLVGSKPLNDRLESILCQALISSDFSNYLHIVSSKQSGHISTQLPLVSRACLGYRDSSIFQQTKGSTAR